MTARDRIVILVVVAVAAVAASWLLVIQPKRDQASKLGAQVQSLQGQLDTARAQLAQNEAARTSFARNYTTLAKLGEAVPASESVPSLIFELQAAANGAKVDFRNITATPSATTSPTTAGSASSSTTGSSSTTASSSSGGSSSSSGASVATPELFSFTFTGSFFQLSSLLNRVQNFVTAANNSVSVSGRLIALNSVQFAAGPEGFPQINAQINGTAYVLPPPQASSSGGTSSGSAGSSSPSSSTTGPAAPTAAVGSPLR